MSCVCRLCVDCRCSLFVVRCSLFGIGCCVFLLFDVCRLFFHWCCLIAFFLVFVRCSFWVVVYSSLLSWFVVVCCVLFVVCY